MKDSGLSLFTKYKLWARHTSIYMCICKIVIAWLYGFNFLFKMLYQGSDIIKCYKTMNLSNLNNCIVYILCKKMNS